jgi:ribosomal protein S27AE
MKYILGHVKYIHETVTATSIICDKCGWSWLIADGGNDLYVCHQCGNDNTPSDTLK